MGGDVGLDSSMGNGSTFWFTALIRRSDKKKSTEPSNMLIPKSLIKLKETFAGAKVLVTEDNKIVQEVFCAILRHAKLDVDTAQNGEDALFKVKHNDYDLMLMDLQMPKMDGLEATRAIRQLPNWKDKPILAITANAFEEDRLACREAGMTDFVAKPVEAEELYAVIYEWLTKTKKSTV